MKQGKIAFRLSSVGTYVPMKSVRTRPSENLPEGLPGKVIPYGIFQDLETELARFPVSA